MKKKWAAIALLAASIPVQAIPVRYDFAGTLEYFSNSDQPDDLAIPLAVQLGDSFTGSFTYDTAFDTDLSPDPAIGQYALRQIVFEVGDYRIELNEPPPLSFDVNFSDNRFNAFDGFSFRAAGFTDQPVPLPTGQNWALNLLLRSSNLDLFDSTALRSDLPSLDEFDLLNQFFLLLRDPASNTGGQASGPLTSLTRVILPEPSTALLILGGMLALAAGRRRCRPA